MDQTIKPIPTLEPSLDFLGLVMVLERIILKPKSSNSSYHIPLLDISIDHNDSVMIFQDLSCKGIKFHDNILHDPIHIGDYKDVNRKEVNKGGFHDHHIILIG